MRPPHRVLRRNSLWPGSSVAALAISVSRTRSDCLSLPLSIFLPLRLSLPLCLSPRLCLSLGCDQAIELGRMPRHAAVPRQASWVWLRLRLRSFVRLRQSDRHRQSASETERQTGEQIERATEGVRERPSRTVGLAVLNSARAVACALGSSSRTGSACGVVHTWRDRHVTESEREEVCVVGARACVL